MNFLFSVPFDFLLAFYCLPLYLKESSIVPDFAIVIFLSSTEFPVTINVNEEDNFMLPWCHAYFE